MTVAEQYVLRDANVLDASGSFAGPLDVRVEHDRVAQTGKNLHAPGLESIDFSGLWLMPGVFDCHDHVAFSTVEMAAVLSTPITRWALEAAQNARLTLESGVTFVRDLCGADRGLRDSLAAGYVPGPRLQISVDPHLPDRRPRRRLSRRRGPRGDADAGLSRAGRRTSSTAPRRCGTPYARPCARARTGSSSPPPAVSSPTTTSP